MVQRQGFNSLKIADSVQKIGTSGTEYTFSIDPRLKQGVNTEFLF